MFSSWPGVFCNLLEDFCDNYWGTEAAKGGRRRPQWHPSSPVWHFCCIFIFQLSAFQTDLQEMEVIGGENVTEYHTSFHQSLRARVLTGTDTEGVYNTWKACVLLLHIERIHYCSQGKLWFKVRDSAYCTKCLFTNTVKDSTIWWW